jgi:hypothetical protein
LRHGKTTNEKTEHDNKNYFFNHTADFGFPVIELAVDIDTYKKFKGFINGEIKLLLQAARIVFALQMFLKCNNIFA